MGKYGARNKWLIFIAVGFELGSAVIAGLVIGSYLDEWAGTKDPYFTLLGLLAGGITGFTLLIRMLRIRNDSGE